jgi:hypothetical protein
MLTEYDTVKISALPQVVSPQPSDEIPMNNLGQTGKANPSQLSADYKSLVVMPTIEALGNRSYKLTFSGVDYSQLFSPGARLRAVRSVAAQVLSAGLNGTNQYLSKSGTINGMTWTDDFTAGAWVKLASYGQVSPVISRFNGTSGWSLQVNDVGLVQLVGFNGSSSNNSLVVTYQSVPLNKWVHVSAQLDMSAFTATAATSYVMIDGVEVPSQVTRAGTNPTALVQAGNLEVGSRSAGAAVFPGKIAQAWASSAKITQANVRTLYSQGLTAALISANNIASAYSLDGNSNDLNTTNANNLTAQNGAATNSPDSPFGIQASGSSSSTIEYAIVQSNVSSGADTIVYVQVPEGGALPTNVGLTSLAYSSVKAPYGFPGQLGKWRIQCLRTVQEAVKTNTTFAQHYGQQLIVPIGPWRLGAHIPMFVSGSATLTAAYLSVSSSTTVNDDKGMTLVTNNNPNATTRHSTSIEKDIENSVATTYYLIGRTDNAIVGYGTDADDQLDSIYADNALL